MLESLNRSLLWFDKPSSRDLYPVAGVTHEWAQASVYAFGRLVSGDESAQVVAGRIHQEFELHASVGSDGRGSVLFTGYYSPSFQGSLTASSEYGYPLYRRPDDLVIDERSGEVLGRQVGEGDGFEPYPTRARLLASGALEGLELVWLRDGFEAYTIQIQGSALIRLPDGTSINVGYDGTNGRPYTSISLELVADGKLREDELSLPEVKDYFRRNPEALEVYARRNDRFVFFRVDSGENWPAGSLGLKVTPLRSLATDKAFFPPGAVVLVETAAPAEGGGTRRLFQFMLDQDTGGAIKSPGHADIYYGIGPLAEVLAGAQYAKGRLYYLLLRPERIDAWRRVMSSERAGSR
ncbi:MAG: MltA domain-containing protein [Candidatus Palauibacterales bacterium]|nr:MltA domain-containing protein [Candidatus Palauibacterales bacterium]